MEIKVLLADDSDIIRGPIVQLLQQEPRIEFVGEASSFAETLKMATTLKPDVLLMDVHMGDGALHAPNAISIELLRWVKHIVAISVWNDDETRDLASRFGACMLLDKVNLAQELLPAILQLATSNRMGNSASSAG